MPVSTSLSASSLNDRSGAKTGVASLTSGATVLLTLLLLAPLFSDLPKAVLGALIIEAVVSGMMDLPEMRRLFRVKKVDFWIAVIALLGTVTFGVLAGVIIGIGLSLIWLIAVATHPEMPTLGRERGTQVFREVHTNPGDEILPGVSVVRFDLGSSTPACGHGRTASRVCTRGSGEIAADEYSECGCASFSAHHRGCRRG